jgi:hypothetical protein
MSARLRFRPAHRRSTSAFHPRFARGEFPSHSGLRTSSPVRTQRRRRKSSAPAHLARSAAILAEAVRAAKAEADGALDEQLLLDLVYLHPQQVGELLQVSTSQVNTWCRTGALEASSAGRSYRVRLRTLLNLPPAGGAPRPTAPDLPPYDPVAFGAWRKTGAR